MSFRERDLEGSQTHDKDLWTSPPIARMTEWSRPHSRRAAALISSPRTLVRPEVDGRDVGEDRGTS